MIRHDSLFIGGRWQRSSSSQHRTVVNPATEAPFADVPLVTDADVDRAVASAREAFDSGPWPHLDPADRIARVEKLADLLSAREDELIELAVQEMGVPVSGSGAGAVRGAIRLLRALCEMARGFPYAEERTGPYGHSLVVREPVGVVGGISPWNGPLFMSLLQFVPALLAGCTGVIKLAVETPMQGFVLGECVREAGIPDGVVSVLSGGLEPSQALVRHPLVDKIVFTGSTEAGRAIAAACGAQLKRCTLELGGKSAAIMLEDGDVDRLVGSVVQSALGSNGQQCYGLTRIVVDRGRYAEVVDALAERVAALRVGDPMDPDTEIGPLISAAQRARVEHYLDLGKEQGARTVVGGARSTIERGYYVQPTLFAEVDNSMTVAREEIFGPVLCVIPADGETEAVASANDSPYGLSGAVFTADRDRGVAVARRVRTGHYTVNGFTMNVAAPFGGFKSSGIGREYGPEGLAGGTELKTINLVK
jgi:betaine-aldehyde dehydrogenase